jgi:hypothetical protein
MGPDEGGKQDGEGGVKKRAGKSLRQCRSSLGCVEPGRSDGKSGRYEGQRSCFLFCLSQSLRCTTAKERRIPDRGCRLKKFQVQQKVEQGPSKTRRARQAAGLPGPKLSPCRAGTGRACVLYGAPPQSTPYPGPWGR